MKNSHKSVTFGLVWICLLVVGSFALNSFSQSSGTVGTLSESWPDKIPFDYSVTGPTLVVFLHPKCSCSRATVGQLDALLAHAPSNLKTYAIFIKPAGFSDRKVRTGLWKDVAEIPGVEIIVDKNGQYAQSFGAETSGHTLLYDQSGKLLFSGGITSARGHMGDNLGQSSILEFLQNKAAMISRTKVFGCSLISRNIASIFGVGK
jgi:hypothetical protein